MPPLGNANPIRDLALLVNTRHQAPDISSIGFSRKPFASVLFPFLSRNEDPIGREVMAGVDADLTIELSGGQCKAVGDRCILNHLVPSITAPLTVFDVIVPQNLVHGIAKRNLPFFEPAIFNHIHPVEFSLPIKYRAFGLSIQG